MQRALRFARALFLGSSGTEVVQEQSHGHENRFIIRVDPKLFVFTFLHFPATKKLTKNRDKFFLDGNSTRNPFSRVLEALAVCLVCYRASKKGHFEVFQTKMKGGC